MFTESSYSMMKFESLEKLQSTKKKIKTKKTCFFFIITEKWRRFENKYYLLYRRFNVSNYVYINYKPIGMPVESTQSVFTESKVTRPRFRFNVACLFVHSLSSIRESLEP